MYSGINTTSSSDPKASKWTRKLSPDEIIRIIHIAKSKNPIAAIYSPYISTNVIRYRSSDNKSHNKNASRIPHKKITIFR